VKQSFGNRAGSAGFEQLLKVTVLEINGATHNVRDPFSYHRASSSGNIVVRQICLGGSLSRPVPWRTAHTRKRLGRKKESDVCKGPVYHWQQCGACCTNQEYDPPVAYVCRTREESKQMRRLGLTVLGAGGSFFLGTRDREGASNPSCVALRGRVGSPCCCAIYRSRPINCRKFDLGGSYCKAVRKEAGLPV
jgi:Fe-S-cluster containining protein